MRRQRFLFGIFGVKHEASFILFDRTKE